MSTDAHVLSFADDISMPISDTDINRLYTKANCAMNNLDESFCVNRFSLNQNKTKSIVFTGGKENATTKVFVWL